MSFELPQGLPENVQNVIRSAVEIVNDDFDYYKFMKAFSQNDIWTTQNNSMPNLSPQVLRNQVHMENDSLKSCPPLRQPVFTFDTTSPPKESRFLRGKSFENTTTETLTLNQTKSEFNIGASVVNNKAEPTLKLQITGNPNYELVESDILDIFGCYGNVQRIEIGRFRTAFIVFDNGMNALTAQKLLNGQYVKHLDIKLYLSWVTPVVEETVKPEETRTRVTEQLPTGLFRSELPSGSGSTPKSQPSSNSNLPSFPFNSAKFTCKYEIQIDNDKDFKIARKIIGPKGCNMKKIIEICQHHLKRSDVIFQSDFLKLRLRGRGSGFKEGPEQKESSDPLHLCVSSKYADVYNLACKLVEDLLSGLYREYEGFCQRAGKPLQEPVQIKRIEIYSGSAEKKTNEDNKANSKQRKDSFDNINQPYVKSLNLSGHSGQDSSNNSLSTLSDPEQNNSPVRNSESVHLEDC